MTRFSTGRRSLVSEDNLEIMLGYAADTPPGAFVEVGVYRGGSALRLYEITERQARALFLFDTFAGHPTPGAWDDLGAQPAGRFSDCADPDELQRELPNAAVVIGTFPWSLWKYLPQIGLGGVAFAHIDVDLYESTHSAIKTLAAYMVPNGIMYFDDYGVPDCPGATKAVDEWFGMQVERLPNGKALVRCR